MFIRKCGSVMKKDCDYEPSADRKDKVKEQANTLLCLYQKMSNDEVIICIVVLFIVICIPLMTVRNNYAIKQKKDSYVEKPFESTQIACIIYEWRLHNTRQMFIRVKWIICLFYVDIEHFTPLLVDVVHRVTYMYVTYVGRVIDRPTSDGIKLIALFDQLSIVMITTCFVLCMSWVSLL